MVILVKFIQHVVFQIVNSFSFFQNLNLSINIDRLVAIKVVSIATVDNAEADLLKEAFLNEVEISNRLRQTSKHIVHMYDFDFHLSGLTFIIMELGQQNLEKTLASRPPLTPAERKVIWRQLVNIAVTLHNNQIVNSFQ